MTDPGLSDDRLTAHLVADLQATQAQLERARLMLADALLSRTAGECRRKARFARTILGSAMQTLALATGVANQLREHLQKQV